MTILEKHTAKLAKMALATRAMQDQKRFMTTESDSVTKGLRMMIQGAEMYCEALKRDTDWLIGNDGVLGLEMGAILNGLLGLLNGSGSFDGGTLDGAIREIAATYEINDVEQ
jgi:hypothetical protein